MALLCAHWGCQIRGCGGAISLGPIPQPCRGSRGVQLAESISPRAGTAPHDSHTLAALLVGFAGQVVLW